jgi:hypothetical protein
MARSSRPRAMVEVGGSGEGGAGEVEDDVPRTMVSNRSRWRRMERRGSGGSWGTLPRKRRRRRRGGRPWAGEWRTQEKRRQRIRQPRWWVPLERAGVKMGALERALTGEPRPRNRAPSP